jgi:hypothetical protein
MARNPWATWLALCLTVHTAVAADTLIATNSTWRYLKGTNEASPADAAAWRAASFSDAAWPAGKAAFYYEQETSSSTKYTGNTVLSDMYGGYTCVFLRQAFTVSNLYDYASLQLSALSDDGFIAWINGQEVARFNMPSGDIAYNGTSSAALSEPVPWSTNFVTNLSTLLVTGTNTLAVQAFNCNLGASSDFTINPGLYGFRDTAAPTVAQLYPAAGSTVARLTSIEVVFSKPVTGVEAGDLLLNGSPAAALTVVSPSQYVFTFTAATNGAAQAAWSTSHGIRDLTSSALAFAGGSWAYTVTPSVAAQGVIINEFLAANSSEQTNSLHDELGKSPDWIELYNPGSSPVSLTGWYLTDDAAKPTKWQFPATIISANSYLVIFASGRNTNVNGRLHTGFKLSSSASYLALLDNATNIISAFSPAYPIQYTDVSYGRDRLDPTLLGYFSTPTPGAANTTRGAGFGPDVLFSRRGGAFLNDFSLTLSTADTNSVIRYILLTTNVASGAAAATNIPTSTSTLYTGPITISGPVEVRARAFPNQTNLWPGEPRTECYIKLNYAAATFSSDLPVLLVHNLGGGSVPQSTDQSVIAMLFEPVNGRTSLTNPPTLVSRAGLNIRGRSTANYAQSSFALEFWDEYNQDSKVEFLGLPAESDWVLFGQNGYDPAFMHNPLTHQLCRDTGRYSSRTRFLEMFLNTAGGLVSFTSPASGNYFGLYTLQEKVKRSGDRLNIEKLESAVTNSALITGGYLFKQDDADSNERTFYNTATQTYSVFQDPPGIEMVSDARAAQYKYVTSYFTQFSNALYSASYTNPVSGYAAYIDVDSWINNHILNAFVYNLDAYRLSSFFYKDRDKKLEMGPLWDFDRTLGAYNPSWDSGDKRCFNPRLWRVQSSGDQGTDFFGNPNLLGTRWWQRLFNDPDFWQRWIDRWSELRQDVLSTNHIFSVVDSLSSQVAQAQPREIARFTYTAPRSGTVTANGYSYTFPGTYAGEIAYLKYWIADRLNFIDTNFLHTPALSSGGGPIASGFQLTITPATLEADTIVYYTLDGTDPRLPGGGISSLASSNLGTTVLTFTNNVRLFARNYNTKHANLTNYSGSVGGNPPISSPWSAPAVATFVTATPTLAITEVMYHPLAPANANADASDYEFIELKNTGSTSVSLVGLRFTNGIVFTFTATNAITNLGAGQYAVLVKNRTNFLSRYPAVTNIAGQYTNSLSNGGERIALVGPMLEPILNFAYNDSWYPTTDGQGFSLVIRNESGALSSWTNPASWRPSTAIYGSPGRADPTPADIPAVWVNEALTHTDLPQLDSVEIYNPTAYPAAIGGWFLTDNHEKPAKYRIPAGTTIPSGGYVVFTQNQFDTGSNAFRFSSHGEEVYLFSGDGTNLTGYRHGFEFGAQFNGRSYGRLVTSDGVEHFVSQQANSLGGVNFGAKVGPVVLSEIQYAPPPFGSNADTLDEYVELRNNTGQPAPLYDTLFPTNSWRLGGGIQYTFPTNISLPAWSYALVVTFDPAQDPVMLDWFRSRYGVDTNTPIFGPFSGHLANEGDHVALYSPDHPDDTNSSTPGYVPYVLIDEVHYQNSLPWPINADGTSNSLQRLSCFLYADEPANWIAAAPSPGRLNPGARLVDSDGDGLPDEWEAANGLDPLSAAGINGAHGDPDNDGFDNLSEYLAGTSPTNSLELLRFEQVSIAGTNCVLAFTPRQQRLYSIEKVSALGGTNTWSPLWTNISGSNTLNFSDPLGSSARFYRIKASVAPYPVGG